jgi:hypothetical protein
MDIDELRKQHAEAEAQKAEMRARMAPARLRLQKIAAEKADDPQAQLDALIAVQGDALDLLDQRVGRLEEFLMDWMQGR